MTCIKQKTCLFQPQRGQRLVRMWFGLDRFHNCVIVISINRLATRATRRMLHVEQELPTLPMHLRSPLLHSGVCVVQSVVFCVMSFFLFLSVIVLYVLLRFTASDYPLLVSSNFSLHCSDGVVGILCFSF